MLAQLLMLIALTPFVVHILGQDAALTDLLRGLSPSLQKRTYRGERRQTEFCRARTRDP